MKKKEILKTIITIIVSVVLSSGISVYATSTYLYDSCDVSYDNTSSGLNATNVQSSLDELYMHATDYTSIDSRVTSLESHFLNNSTIKFTTYGIRLGNEAPSTSNTYIDFYNNGSMKGNIYTGSNSPNGLTIGGYSELNLTGSPVKINGIDMSSKYTTYITPLTGTGEIALFSIGNIVMIKFYNYNPGNITQRTNIGTIPTGYRPPTEVTFSVQGNYDGSFGITSSGTIWIDPSLKSRGWYTTGTYVRWQ